MVAEKKKADEHSSKPLSPFHSVHNSLYYRIPNCLFLSYEEQWHRFNRTCESALACGRTFRASVYALLTVIMLMTSFL